MQQNESLVEQELETEKLVGSIMDNGIPASHPVEQTEEELFNNCKTTLWFQKRKHGLVMTIQDTETGTAYGHFAVPTDRIGELLKMFIDEILKETPISE